MAHPPPFTSVPVKFSVDEEQGQMLVVGGSPLKRPTNGALWLVRNDGPDQIELFDDHNRTVDLAVGSDVFFDQTPEVNVAVRLKGTRLTTGTFRLVKAQPWNDVSEREVHLRGHGSVSCISLAPAEGHGHWAVTYVSGTREVAVMAAHPSGPGGNNGEENYKYLLTLNHDSTARSIIVYKPHGKELSIHISTNGHEPQDYAVCRCLGLQDDYWP